MKLHRKYIFAILVVATLCFAINSSALTLGRAKGVVFLGQALTLTVPVQMDAGEGTSALCFEADVFYGDVRQDASRIGVSSELSPQSQSANVTVFARATVDEPVVTVYLRAGCENKTTRRYVLLAELAAPVVPAPRVVSSAPLASTTQATSIKQLQPGTATTGLRAIKRTNSMRVGAKSEPTPGALSAPKAQKSVGHRPHLKLAPWDLVPERDPILKLSNELMVADTEDPQKRAQAVALWRSLNATPQDIAGSESRRQALESDLKGLHDITVKNRQVLEDLTRRLGKAESERFSNPLVYALLALIVLCCLAIAYGWNRAPRGLAGAPWWRDDGSEDKSKTVAFSDDAAPTSDIRHEAVKRTSALPVGDPTYETSGQSSPGATRTKDIDFILEDPADDGQKCVEIPVKKSKPFPVIQKKSVPLSSSGHIDFSHSMSATLRSVNTKEMLDVRQQADFFMTLGQHDEAVALLSESVEGSADANPLVYLELLKVLHTLGRKAEYDNYRSGFNAIFNGQVPAYTDFNHAGSGLEAYPETCQRIVALWPSNDVVSFIENCLVRDRKESGGQEFDLEAFRDLLMLHGVASRIASSSFDSGFMAFSAAKTVPAAMGGASEVDLDLDLSEPHGNLIDFDASGWSPPTTADDKQKPR